MNNIPLELNTESKDVIGEIDEAKLVEHLDAFTGNSLKIIEKQTERRTTIDSITTSVPSSSLNTATRNSIEQDHLLHYKLARRVA